MTRWNRTGRVLTACMAWCGAAFAQGPDSSPPSAQSQRPQPTDTTAPDAQDSLARAKDLFRQGVALFEAGEVDRALDLFRRSRALYPSAKNTVNAALCLDRLGRWDEALEMYEAAIAKHSKELDDEDKAGARSAMATLRTKVGALTLSYNVPGNVVVDGRPRGTLPLTTPLRLMPGRHVVRVLKDGYSSYEATVDIRVGTTTSLDARLTALAASGGLRVEDATATGADVVVDGAVVGTSPWEGSLAPGTHVVQSRAQGQVSTLAKAVIVQGQTTLLRLTSRPAGPALYLSVEPITAELSIDGIPLGRGRWEGALPASDYSISGTEEGYFPENRQIRVGDATGPVERVRIKLKVDEAHPRWPKRPAGHVWLALFAGAAVGPTLRSGPESDCRTGCDNAALASGAMGGVRTGYELPWLLSLEIMAGYATLWTRPERGATATYETAGLQRTVEYRFEDTLRFKGPMVGLGASYPLRMGAGWSLRTRATLGLFFISSVDRVTGTARSAVDQLPVDIAHAGEQVRSTPMFVMPEIGAEHVVGPLRLGATLGLLFVPQSGPKLPHATVTTPPGGCPGNAASAACAPQSALLRDERAYGPFMMLVPSVNATYVF